MNIFYLHPAPEIAAAYMHDKHVVKMCLETAQILSSVYGRYNHATLYKPTHQNHPSVLWAGDTVAQYRWLARHGKFLCQEYTHRYGKIHACEEIIDALSEPPAGLHVAGWREPPQCMPPEFQQLDTVSAYRAYYLSRKVQQSRWTLREVPPFVKEDLIMAKKPTPAKTAAEAQIPMGAAAPAETPATTEGAAPAPTTEAPKVPLAKMRGPRGVPETAKISLLVATNPKRPGSKAHTVFSQYVDGMTVGAFCDLVDASTNADGSSNKGAGTPNLVYDTAHGFIAIEGYAPPGGVITPKPKAAPKPKAEKVAKAPGKAEAAPAPAPSAEDTAAAAAAVTESAGEEVIE